MTRQRDHERRMIEQGARQVRVWLTPDALAALQRLRAANGQLSAQQTVVRAILAADLNREEQP